MRTYAAVVTTGSFTGAAGRLGISRALASKYVGQLEAHLGARLLNRTTRKLNVTEVGQAYYQRCRQLLDDMDELEAAVRQQQDVPQGQLLITAPTTFGEMYLTRAVADYLAEQPGVSVNLVLADRYVNLVEEGFDLAVRIGQLVDSSLIARRLAQMRIVLCASPGYLKHAGVPAHPEELAAHRCIIDTNIQNPGQWSFNEQGRHLRVKVDGRFRVNNALAVREMLLAGQGIGFCPLFVIEEDIRTGRLQVLFEEFEASRHGIYAVYPHNRQLAAKVRTFVDFLVRRFSAYSERES
jgi:DNA-binding transcriptional LysR family regulator